MTKKIVYVGTFDPIHNGHIEIIKRESKLFDEVIVGVAENCGDKNPMLSYKQRVQLTNDVIADLKLENVKACGYSNTTVEFAKSLKAAGIARAMRTKKDFEDESTFSTITRALSTDLDVNLIISDAKYSDLSSTKVRECIRKKEPINNLVPERVARLIESLDAKPAANSNAQSINWKLKTFASAINFWQKNAETIKQCAGSAVMGAILAKCLL